MNREIGQEKHVRLTSNFIQEFSPELLNTELQTCSPTLLQGSFIYYVHKIFRKTKISYLLIRTCSYAYQGVRNVSFSQNFVNVINERSPTVMFKWLSRRDLLLIHEILRSATIFMIANYEPNDSKWVTLYSNWLEKSGSSVHILRIYLGGATFSPFRGMFSTKRVSRIFVSRTVQRWSFTLYTLTLVFYSYLTHLNIINAF